MTNVTRGTYKWYSIGQATQLSAYISLCQLIGPFTHARSLSVKYCLKMDYKMQVGTRHGNVVGVNKSNRRQYGITVSRLWS